MASKIIICIVLAALVGCAVAQLLPISGTHDITGGYYDHYTGQYSSALTGRVFNTAPAVVAGNYSPHLNNQICVLKKKQYLILFVLSTSQPNLL